MFKDIKSRLLEAPDSIINLLLEYDFYKPQLRHQEIRCGLYEGSNSTAICIRLVNNDNLYVTDFSRNISLDLINYVMKVRGVSFKDVLLSIKTELGIENFYSVSHKYSAFDGFYSRIKSQDSDMSVVVYPESLLDEYQDAYILRFLKDNISLETQNEYEIAYDPISQRIVIPIRNQYGELIGVKGRCSWDAAEDEAKYLYLVPCAASLTLYGFSQNYLYLQGGDILVFESEKSVLQCHSYGYHNAVALGSNSLSNAQCKLLLGLQPKRIIFMLDKSLDLQNTFNNAEKLKAYLRMSDVELLYWDWTINTTLPDKASPSDFGAEILQNILNAEIKTIGGQDNGNN